MSGFKAFMHGLRSASARPGLSLVAYLGTWLAALPAMVITFPFIHRQVSHSVHADRFASRLDPLFFISLYREHSATFTAVVVAGCAGGVIFGIVGAFFRTAELAVLEKDERGISRFFEAGGRHFGTTLRLLPLGWIALGVLGVLPLVGLNFLASKLTEDWMSGPGRPLIRFSALAVGLLFVLWAATLHDLMRLAIVRDRVGALRAFARGLVRGIRHPLCLLAAVGPLAVAAVGLSLLVTALDFRWSRSSAAAIVLGLVLQQGLVLVRSALRIGSAAAVTAWRSTPASPATPATPATPAHPE